MRLARGTVSPAVAVVDLEKRFGPVAAVQGVTFDVERGEIFALLGSGGAGKSTILRMLGALLPPSAGRATVAGYDVVERSRAVRRRVSLEADPGAVGRRSCAVLLVDEAPAGADPACREARWHDIRRVREQGTTVVVATSSVDDAEQADRIAIVDQGRIAAVGSPLALKAAVPVGAGASPARLDEAFLHLTGRPFQPQGDVLGAARRFMAAHLR